MGWSTGSSGPRPLCLYNGRACPSSQSLVPATGHSDGAPSSVTERTYCSSRSMTIARGAPQNFSREPVVARNDARKETEKEKRARGSAQSVGRDVTGHRMPKVAPSLPHRAARRAGESEVKIASTTLNKKEHLAPIPLQGKFVSRFPARPASCSRERTFPYYTRFFGLEHTPTSRLPPLSPAHPTPRFESWGGVAWECSCCGC